MTEHEIQCKFIRLIDRMNSTQKAGILYCATQGGVRVSIGTARKMVASGYRKGIPDLIIYNPQGGKVGLALELKTKIGKTSEFQDKWIEDLQSHGWEAKVVKGFDECADALFDYFKDLKRPKVL